VSSSSINDGAAVPGGVAAPTCAAVPESAVRSSAGPSASTPTGRSPGPRAAYRASSAGDAKRRLKGHASCEACRLSIIRIRRDPFTRTEAPDRSEPPLRHRGVSRAAGRGSRAVAGPPAAALRTRRSREDPNSTIVESRTAIEGLGPPYGPKLDSGHRLRQRLQDWCRWATLNRLRSRKSQWLKGWGSPQAPPRPLGPFRPLGPLRPPGPMDATHLFNRT